MGLPSVDHFHGALILEWNYSIGIEEALDGEVGLFMPNHEDDPPQKCLKEGVVRTTTLWDRKYITHA
jgi:hypothetical protein